MTMTMLMRMVSVQDNDGCYSDENGCGCQQCVVVPWGWVHSLSLPRISMGNTVEHLSSL